MSSRTVCHTQTAQEWDRETQDSQWVRHFWRWMRRIMIREWVRGEDHHQELKIEASSASLDLSHVLSSHPPHGHQSLSSRLVGQDGQSSLPEVQQQQTTTIEWLEWKIWNSDGNTVSLSLYSPSFHHPKSPPHLYLGTESSWEEQKERQCRVRIILLGRIDLFIGSICSFALILLPSFSLNFRISWTTREVKLSTQKEEDVRREERDQNILP